MSISHGGVFSSLSRLIVIVDVEALLCLLCYALLL